MKLSVHFSCDVVVKWSWLHGRGTKIMVAAPSFPKVVVLSNTLQKPRQKIKIFQKFFLQVFIWCKKLQKHIWNIFLSTILRELKKFPGAFQSIYFQVSLDYNNQQPHWDFSYFNKHLIEKLFSRFLQYSLHPWSPTDFVRNWQLVSNFSYFKTIFDEFFSVQFIWMLLELLSRLS